MTTATKPSSVPQPKDATAMLIADHKEVIGLFAEYEKARSPVRKKDLVAQVEGVAPDGEMFDAKIKVMSEFVNHHVKEEQNEMFPKARKSKLDLVALGAQISRRRMLRPKPSRAPHRR